MQNQLTNLKKVTEKHTLHHTGDFTVHSGDE